MERDTFLIERRPALLLLAGCTLPFAVGAAAFSVSDAGTHGPHLGFCPLRYALGIPCPFCGTTRSVAAFAHLDGSFWDYNPFWVLVLLAGALVALLGLLPGTASRVDAALRERFRRPGWWVLAPIVAGWAVSLAHRGAIVG